MLGYDDRTFCISPLCENKCGRKLTKEIQEAGDKWYGEGPGKCPFSVSFFCGGDLNREWDIRKTKSQDSDGE